MDFTNNGQSDSDSDEKRNIFSWNLKGITPTEPPYLYEIVWAKMSGYAPWPGIRSWGDKTVEIDESKIGKRKYNKGHFVEGQWVFGGVERKTGRCFLVAVNDRTAETLLGLIESWIEPGTTVISDCWKSYERLSERGYHHLTVNHLLEFIDSETGAHTNTIEVTWRHFKASLPECNRKGRFEGYIAWYMFRKICFALKKDPFIKFLDLVRNINWAEWRIISGGGVEESNS
ncbi:putative transposase-like protein [Trichonephila clavipes]|nr:putative transposase-like protein [Trichonephila clavipes]